MAQFEEAVNHISANKTRSACEQHFHARISDPWWRPARNPSPACDSIQRRSFGSVAIKALHPAFNQDPSFAARFQREARVVAKLEHPNIVPIHDFAEHDGRPYLVMKCIEGDTLKARLDQGPLSSEEISKIVNAVSSALAYAHHQGILHRDIKPSNVLLANDGQIYLADFGLARIAGSGEATLTSDVIIGTPQYISPEQAMGEREITAWSLATSALISLCAPLRGSHHPCTTSTPTAIATPNITPLPRMAPR